jgi:hypothetical protein
MQIIDTCLPQPLLGLIRFQPYFAGSYETSLSIGRSSEQEESFFSYYHPLAE